MLVFKIAFYWHILTLSMVVWSFNTPPKDRTLGKPPKIGPFIIWIIGRPIQFNIRSPAVTKYSQSLDKVTKLLSSNSFVFRDVCNNHCWQWNSSGEGETFTHLLLPFTEASRAIAKLFTTITISCFHLQKLNSTCTATSNMLIFVAGSDW